MPNYTLGPEDGILSVRTSRTGAVAKAGHDLLIHVTEWSATLDTDAPGVTLDADATSLRVREGTGGMKALDEDDLTNIETTIDDEVLLRRDIRFRSTSVTADGDSLAVTGDLTLVGTTHPITFDLTLADGRVNGVAVVKQTDWGMKPYTALFGALKVADGRAGGDRRPPASVAVDGLRVEPALHARGQRAGAVRVERDVLDRLEAVARRPRAVRPRQRVGLTSRAPCRRAAAPCRGSWPSRW